MRYVVSLENNGITIFFYRLSKKQKRKERWRESRIETKSNGPECRLCYYKLRCIKSSGKVLRRDKCKGRAELVLIDVQQKKSRVIEFPVSRMNFPLLIGVVCVRN